MIVCDIDGCIFDNTHRAHLIPEDKSYTPNWTVFNKACGGDRAILPVINLVKFMAKLTNYDDDHRKITFVTSRDVAARKQTESQLFQHFKGFRCKLLMREMDDHRDTVDYKRAVFNQLSDKFKKDSIIIDDHPGIIEMVKKSFPQVNRLLVPSFDCTVIK